MYVNHDAFKSPWRWGNPNAQNQIVVTIAFQETYWIFNPYTAYTENAISFNMSPCFAYYDLTVFYERAF